MRHRSPTERRCSYVVILGDASGSAARLRELAAYLSEIAVLNFEVLIIDGSTPADFDENHRVLRWVGRHIPVRPEHLSASGNIDAVRASTELASCEKIIVADAHVRYGLTALDDLTTLLEAHEVVEPQDYFDPLPWWGGIEAGRILVRRSIQVMPDRGSTFGFRKRAVRGLRSIDHGAPSRDCVRRLASQGAEVFSAVKLFVRRVPPAFSEWIRDVPRRASEEPALFFMLLPAIIAVALTGGVQMAGAFAGTIAFTSVVLALRGRIGAGRFFPLRAVLFAPLWLLQRSVSIYCVLFWRVRRAGEPRRIPITVRADGEQVASGK